MKRRELCEGPFFLSQCHHNILVVINLLFSSFLAFSFVYNRQVIISSGFRVFIMYNNIFYIYTTFLSSAVLYPTCLS